MSILRFLKRPSGCPDPLLPAPQNGAEEAANAAVAQLQATTMKKKRGTYLVYGMLSLTITVQV